MLPRCRTVGEPFVIPTFDVQVRDVEGFMDELQEFQSVFHDCFTRSETRAHFETVAELPGLASPCTMKCCQGLLTAFGVGFTPHIQRQARTNLRLRPHSVDT